MSAEKSPRSAARLRALIECERRAVGMVSRRPPARCLCYSSVTPASNTPQYKHLTDNKRGVYCL